jgi:serine phosphatase RsbU (regulator of sigma subunit)
LRRSADSLKNLANINTSLNQKPKEELVRNSPEINNSKQNSRETLQRAVKGVIPKEIADSLLRGSRLPAEEPTIFNIPKYQKYIDTIRRIINSANSTLENNEKTISNNKSHIDTLRMAVDSINKSGQNLDRLDALLEDIDSLLAYNFELSNLNKGLTENKAILEKELKMRELLYDSLVRLIIFLVTVSILIILIAIGVYKSYRQKKKFSDQLSNFNKILEKVNEDLNTSNQQLLDQNREIQSKNIDLSRLNDEKGSLLQLISNELKIAADYVLSLIPKPITTGAIKTDWLFIPSEDLGGDAFGYNWIDNENFAFYLLDVSGHGVGPALHSVQVLNILQNHTLPNVDFTKPEEVLNSLNEIFQVDQYNFLFFTLWYGVYNVNSRTLKYSSAGHPPVILYNPDEVRLLESQNIFIGAKKIGNYLSDTVKVEGISSLYLFSDGVYEIKTTEGKMFDFNDFKDQILVDMENKKMDLSSLYENAKKLYGMPTLNDDFSILRVKFD